MKKYLDVVEGAGKQFFLDYNGKGKVVMLNLLKYKSVADYSHHEDLQAETAISGKEAYNIYMNLTMPFLEEARGKVLFFGKCSSFLIGPDAPNWDAVLLVEHESASKFIEFAQNEAYLKIVGHRTAALEDSRLLPISEIQNNFLRTS